MVNKKLKDMLGHRKRNPDGSIAVDNVFTEKLSEIKDTPINQKVIILGKGTILGEEDLTQAKNTYQCSIMCESQKGTLFRVPKAHFVDIMKNKKTKF